MRKYLLPENGRFYKANLHSHSVFSDGALTPLQMKELYKSHGYSIIAYTDHTTFFSHNELTDGEFLALNGYEPDVTEKMDDPTYHFHRTFHACFIALSEDIKEGVDVSDMEMEYNPVCINELMRRGREAGFFVTYNHPVWSLERYPTYITYENMNAMEMVNYGCLVCGYPEYNELIYDDMLLAGKRIFCISTDDNHNKDVFDSFGGFTMIKAERLDYPSVAEALKSGSFYASEGPEIKSLYVEDGVLYAETSPAREIRFNTGTRAAATVLAPEGETVTGASIKLDKADVFVRLTVTDREGKHANSNAYFLDTL